MSAQLIKQAAADGVQLFLADGRVGYRGKPEALRRWLPRIKEQRDDIAAALATPPVLWWRFAVHCPARTVEIDFASGVTEAEGVEIVRTLYPDATAAFPLLSYTHNPEAAEPREADERIPARTSGTDAVLVRCCNCGHFTPHEAHATVGRCGAGKLPPGAAGFWGTDNRHCEQFEPREQINDTRSINHPTTPEGGN